MKNKQDGLTLIEVLISITILGIVLTSFLSFFNHAYSYTKKNQNKTVGINVARNVLNYIEQQDYDAIKTQYLSSATPSPVVLTIGNCTDPVFNSTVCKDFFSSTINNVNYTTYVKLTNGSSGNSLDLSNYLIDVEVEVKWDNQVANVRGVIKK